MATKPTPKQKPPLIKCRGLEVYFFATPAAMLVYVDRMLMVRSAADPGVMLMNWYRLILQMALLIAGYTLFIPAGWKRTLIVTSAIGSVPFVALGVMVNRRPKPALPANTAWKRSSAPAGWARCGWRAIGC